MALEDDISRAFAAAHGDMMVGMATWHRVQHDIKSGELKKIEVDDRDLAKKLLKYIKSVGRTTKVYLDGKEFTGGFWLGGQTLNIHF